MSTIDRREVLKRAAHAMGYTLSAATLANLAGCAKEPVKLVDAKGDTISEAPASKYAILTQLHADTIYALNDVIIPSGATPGANDIDAIAYLDSFVSIVYDAKKQANFINGLDFLITDVKDAYKKNYADLTEAEKVAYLTVLEEEVFEGKAENQTGKHHFYRQFKGMLLNTYYQSRVVGEEILAYDPVPGQQIGCYDYDGKSWSL